MAVSIYQFPKPVIELSLEAGGSLAPSTTYYFGARFCGAYMGFGQLSDQYSITTDTTNLSIRVKVKWDDSGSWNYNRPTLSFYTSNLAYFQIIWDSSDMTDGAGNWVKTSGTNIAFIQGTSTTYNVVYTTNPVKAAQYYQYIPERYLAGGTPGGGVSILPSTFSTTQGNPIIYTSSSSDTWANVVSAITGFGAGFTNYIFSGARNYQYLDIFANFYFPNTVTMNDLNLTLYYGGFISSGTHNRCTIHTMTNSNIGSGGPISIANGNDNILKGDRYRQGFLINGNNNSIYAFNGQIAIGENDSSKRNYIQCFLLTNGMNNNNNFNCYNSIIYDQKMSTDQSNSNIYQYIDKDTILSTWYYDINVMNGFDNTPTTRTLYNYSIDTNRVTSEGINYSGDKLPRFYWGVKSGTTYVPKTYDFKNSIDLYVTDEDGNAIDSVSVSISNDLETLTDTTDSNGYLQKYILIRRAVQDASYTSSTYYTTWTDKKIVNITISKSGYETYSGKLNLITKRDLYITLKKSPLAMADSDGGGYAITSPAIGTKSGLTKL